MIQVLGKSGIDQKSTNTFSSNHYDGPYGGWEKRGRGRYFDYDKRGGFHSEWEKRSFYGVGDREKRSSYRGDWEKHGNYSSIGRQSDSFRESHGLVDTGRPPGNRGNTGSESPTPMMVAPVILSRARTSGETKSTSATTPSQK